MRLCLSIASWLLAAGLPAAGFVSGSFPMEGGDLQRSNTALAPSSVEGPLEAAWSTTLPALGGDTRGNPLLLPDRALVVRDGSLTAIRRSDGSLLYSVSTLSSAATGSLDLVRGLIYLNGHQGTLAAYRTSDGGLAWSKAEPALAGAANRGSSVLADGRLFYGTAGKGFVAVDPSTQAELWRHPSDVSYLTAAYAEGRLYVPDTGGWLSCLDAVTGALLWQVRSDLPFSSAATLGPDLVYVQTHSGRVEARRRSNGSLAWSFQAQSWAAGNLALTGDTLLVANDDRHLYALDAHNGTELWRRSFHGNFARMAPLVSCNSVYLSGCVGEYYGLDLATGAQQWAWDHEIFDSFVDWAVDGDHLYVMDRKGRLHAFRGMHGSPGLPCGGPRPQAEPQPGPCAIGADPDLRLWLDAGQGIQADAQGFVGKWMDASGHGHHAQATGARRPRLQTDALGRPRLYFDGNDRLYASGSGLLSGTAMTLVVLAQAASNGGTRQAVLGAWDREGALPWLGSEQFRWASGDGLKDPAAIKAGGQVLAWRQTSSGAVLRVNSTVVAQRGATKTLRSDAFFSVGSAALGASDAPLPLLGYVWQVLIYRRALSDAELAALEACLLNGRAATPTPTATVSPTATISPSSTASPTATPTATPSPTVSATPSQSQTFTPSPSAGPSFTPTPTLTPSPPPKALCSNALGGLQAWPNPWHDPGQARASVLLLCPAERVDLELYSAGGSLLARWSQDASAHPAGNWLHCTLPPGLLPANGLHLLKASVHHQGKREHKVARWMVLR